jgi:peroxiredoxin
MRIPSRDPRHVYYFTDCFRLGEIKFGSAARKVAVIDNNVDGLFNDLENTVLLIDTDGDGKLNGRLNSHEWHSAAEPFNVEGKTYEVASLDAPGTQITLRVSSKQVPPKPPLTRGSPALDFTAQDVNGKAVSLSALKGKTVLLVFWSLNDAESWRQLPNIKRVHQTFQEKGLVVIGISQDKDVKALKDFLQDRDVDWTQICDGADSKLALSKLYRVHNLPSHFLIDGKGIIIGLGQRGQDLYDAIEAATSKQ